MKIELKRLYSNPEVFDPIVFTPGVNIILGERVSEEGRETKKDKKTSGVGKSICIEFINFCLLKTSSSRLNKIPTEKFNPETKVVLELEINSEPLIVSRSKAAANTPEIDFRGKHTVFDSVEDASKYLQELLFTEYSEISVPSLRGLLGPIIREEESEFCDILNCYSPSLKIPVRELLEPHFFFFSLVIERLQRINKGFVDIDKSSKVLRKVKDDLKSVAGGSVKEVKATLNELNREIEKIDDNINQLESNAAYADIHKSLVTVNSKLGTLRQTQYALEYQIKKISSFPKPEDIDVKDIELVYSNFSAALGNTVAKSLKQVLAFKQEVEGFQNLLFKEKNASLSKELDQVVVQVSSLETERARMLKGIEAKKSLFGDIKLAYNLVNSKKEKHAGINSLYQWYNKANTEKRDFETNQAELFRLMNKDIESVKSLVADFESTMLTIHEYIVGNKKASFEIRVPEKISKRIIDITLRTDDDGSHTTNRTKVFIYDVALLFNEKTRQRHPGFLIHDNIFEVDQDTLVQSLNYLDEKEKTQVEFQYVLTLNRDRIEAEEKKGEIKLSIPAHTIAIFTKQKKFLRCDYQEKGAE